MPSGVQRIHCDCFDVENFDELKEEEPKDEEAEEDNDQSSLHITVFNLSHNIFKNCIFEKLLPLLIVNIGQFTRMKENLQSLNISCCNIVFLLLVFDAQLKVH